MSQIRRRHIGNKTGDGIILPTGYTRIDYVTNTRKKTISLSISAPFEAFIDCAPHLTQLSGYGCVIGQNLSLQIGYNAAGKASVGNSTSGNVFFEEGKRCEIYAYFSSNYADTKYFVDGVDTVLHRSVTVNKFNLFGNGNGGGNENPCIVDTFSIRIVKNGVDVYHFIPCIRNTDNIKGVYDIVNDTFISDAFN